MFDKLFLNLLPSRMTVESKTTVEERRAPTDESVRLLREMEAAAERKLLAIVRLAQNELTATAHIFDDKLASEKRIVIRFGLNGEQYETTVTLPASGGVEACAAAIRDGLTKTLASILAEVVVREKLTELYGVAKQ